MQLSPLVLPGFCGHHLGLSRLGCWRIAGDGVFNLPVCRLVLERHQETGQMAPSRVVGVVVRRRKLHRLLAPHQPDRHGPRGPMADEPVPFPAVWAAWTIAPSLDQFRDNLQSIDRDVRASRLPQLARISSLGLQALAVLQRSKLARRRRG